MFQEEVLQTIKSHILCSKTSSQKLCHLWGNMEKYGTARQATNASYNAAHAQCMVDK